MLKRSDVPANRKWRTEDIFKSDEEWNIRYKETEKKLDFSEFQGKLSDAGTFLKFSKRTEETERDLTDLHCYAFLKYDEDTKSSLYSGMKTKVERLFGLYSASTAFAYTEMSALPLATLESFANDPRLKDYDYRIRCLIKGIPHILSRETEEVLSYGSTVFGGFHRIFTMLDNADFPVPVIDVDGKKTEVTHGMYGVLLRSTDRATRKKAFKAYYAAYGKMLNTLATTYSLSVEKDVFLSRVKKYTSALDMATSNEDVDQSVYHNLVKTVNRNLPMFHRYYSLRKKILGMSSQHMYDLFIPVADNADISVDYEEAFQIVKKGLSPLGKEYGKLLQKAHDSGWIDVEETEGKRSGAYSLSTYGLKHPYVLLNYQKTTDSVFTLAHELGHAMHSWHSERNQPQSKADYTIFVAEVASTVNEVLLLRYLLSNSQDVNLRKYLLAFYLDMLKSTLFRQTQFAEFELRSHEMAERGEVLTKDSLSEMYYELNKKYYGRSVINDPEIAFEWARIPHFYRSFYVYKYATGITSAVSIAERILSGEKNAVSDYFAFLSSGGSNSPVELLKIAGVDLTSSKPYSDAMASFKSAMDELEKLSV